MIATCVSTINITSHIDMLDTQIYGACLKISEPVNRRLMNQLMKEYEKHLMDYIKLNSANRFLPQRLLWVYQQLQEEKEEQIELKFYSNTCITLLSHHPYFQQFKQFLCQLYQVLLSPSRIPIERFVGHFMTKLSFPFVNNPPTVLKFGAKHDAQAPIVFNPMSSTGFPDIAFDMAVLFRYLSPENVVNVLNLLLVEAKVVIHSRFQSILTVVMESLRALLFPLAWQCVYIPVCPESMLEVVREAPVSYLIGVNSKWATNSVLPPDIWVVDLNRNKISYTKKLQQVPSISGSDSMWITPIPVASGSRSPSIILGNSAKQATVKENGQTSLAASPSSKTINNPIASSHSIPPKVRSCVVKILMDATRSHATLLSLGKGINPDAAFGVAPQVLEELKNENELFNRTVRNAVLCMMVELIGGYRAHLVPPQARPTFMGNLSPLQLPEIFNVEGFVKSEPKSHLQFLSELVKTQSFTKFCDERTFSAQNNLGPRFLFFDTAVEAQLGTSQKPPTPPSGGRSPTVTSSPDGRTHSQSIAPTSTKKYSTNSISINTRRFSHSARRRQSVQRNSVLAAASHLLPSKAMHSHTTRRKSSASIRRSSQSITARTRPGLLVDVVIETQRKPTRQSVVGSPRPRTTSSTENVFEAGGGEDAYRQDQTDSNLEIMESFMSTMLENRQQLQHDGGRFRRTSSMVTPPSYVLHSLLNENDDPETSSACDVSTSGDTTSPTQDQYFQYDQFPRLNSELIRPYEVLVAKQIGQSGAEAGIIGSSSLQPNPLSDGVFNNNGSVLVLSSGHSKQRSASDFDDRVKFDSDDDDEATEYSNESSESDHDEKYDECDDANHNDQKTQMRVNRVEPKSLDNLKLEDKSVQFTKRSRNHSNAKNTISARRGTLASTRQMGALFENQALRARAVARRRGTEVLNKKPYRTFDATDLRANNLAGFTLAGVRIHAELEQSSAFAATTLERASKAAAEAASSSIGDPTGPLANWVLHTLLELLGAWYVCLPALVLYSPAPRHALLIAFSVMERATKQGIELDEACYRALLISCGHCGPSFATDAERLFRRMCAKGINPNALTYGYYSRAVTKAESWHHFGTSRKRMARQRWNKIRLVTEVFIALYRLKNNKLSPSIQSAPRSTKTIQETNTSIPQSRIAHTRVATSLNMDEFVNAHPAAKSSQSCGTKQQSHFTFAEQNVCEPTQLQGSLRGRSGRSFSLDDETPGNLRSRRSASMHDVVTPNSMLSSSQHRERDKWIVDNKHGPPARGRSMTVGSAVPARHSSLTVLPQESGVSPRNGPQLRNVAQGSSEGQTPEKDESHKARMIVMWSIIACPNCEYQLLDEEVMAGWGDDDTYYAVKCPVCEFSLVPKLNFRVVGNPHTDPLSPEGGATGYIGNISGSGPSEGQHEYMSPIMLRRAIERVLDKFGPLALHRMELKRVNPAVYWNLLWYCTRLRLLNPLYFDRKAFSTENTGTITREYIQCGWDGGAVLVHLGMMDQGASPDDALRGGEAASSIARAKRRFSRTKLSRNHAGTVLVSNGSGSVTVSNGSETVPGSDGSGIVPGTNGSGNGSGSLVDNNYGDTLSCNVQFDIFGQTIDEELLFARAAATAATASSPESKGGSQPLDTGDVNANVDDVGEGFLALTNMSLNCRMSPQTELIHVSYSTLWGNLPLEQLIVYRVSEIQDDEALVLTTNSSIVDVLSRLHCLVHAQCLCQAVVLFLRMRSLTEPLEVIRGTTRKGSIDSNVTANTSSTGDDQEQSEHSNEEQLLLDSEETQPNPRVSGWGVFQNSMYTELLWLTRIRAKPSSQLENHAKSSSSDGLAQDEEDSFEVLYQEALIMIPWLDKSLLRVVRPHDNPPSQWAATFRSVYGQLIP